GDPEVGSGRGAVEDCRGPDLLGGAAAAVGPRREEGAVEPVEVDVVAELVAAVGARGRLVGGRGRHLEWCAPGQAVVGRGLVVQVDRFTGRVAHGVVVDQRDLGARWVHHQPGHELIVEPGLIVDFHRRRPGRAAVGGAREENAGLAGGGGVGAGAAAAGAAGVAGEIVPGGVDVVPGGIAEGAAGDIN